MSASEPAVSVSVAHTADSSDRVEARISDEGPGVPDCIVEMLEAGRDTADTRGGDRSVARVLDRHPPRGRYHDLDPRSEGTVVTVTLPASENEVP